MKVSPDIIADSENREIKQKGSSLVKQLTCAFVINLVALLQGASVSTSSIIIHELQNSTDHDVDNHCHRGANCSSDNSFNLGPFFVLNDFHITQEEGSWIGRLQLYYSSHLLYSQYCSQ